MLRARARWDDGNGKKINKKKNKGKELLLKWKREKTTNKYTCEKQKTTQVKSFEYNKVYLHKYRKENLEEKNRS